MREAAAARYVAGLARQGVCHRCRSCRRAAANKRHSIVECLALRGSRTTACAVRIECHASAATSGVSRGRLADSPMRVPRSDHGHTVRRSSQAVGVLQCVVIRVRGCATTSLLKRHNVSKRLHVSALRHRREQAMPYVRSTGHAQRVRRALEGQLPASPDAARLVSSWRRSYEQYRLDPSSPCGPRVLTAAELRAIKERDEAFLLASGDCLARLHEMVRIADYCVMLTNAHGVTIDYRVDSDRRSVFKQAGLYVGSCWSEREEGTCGIAGVLTDLAPITVHRVEHFRAAFTALTCSAAPIFAPSGELIGVLDASAVQSPESRDSQRLVHQLVRQSAHLIEDAYFLNRTTKDWVLLGHTSPEFVEARPEWLIAFDEAGTIVAANRRARACLPALDAAARIDAVFDSTSSELCRLARYGAVVPLRLSATGRTVYARVRGPARPVARSGVAMPHPGVRSQEYDDACDIACEEAGTLARLSRSVDARVARNARVARRVAGKRLPMLLSGETGVGKEVFARAIHEAGRRKAGPFVAINCGAIPDTLIESELFGYAPGAFTGARQGGAKGKLALADGGTLFLDEIGDMPLALQTRLLRVLAEGEVVPLGGHTGQRVEFDLICATHRDLRAMVEAGTFREDLYYRLSGATLVMPPLRERADMRDVIDAVFDEEAQAAGQMFVLDARLADLLCTYAWPGNIRELRNVLRYACAVSDTATIGVRHLPPDLAEKLGVAESQLAAQYGEGFEDERAKIVDALKRHRWRPNPAAHALGISRATLYRRMAKWKIVGPHRM
jgi:transcriptional regulator of acetoin/glycerol metabolism